MVHGFLIGWFGGDRPADMDPDVPSDMGYYIGPKAEAPAKHPLGYTPKVFLYAYAPDEQMLRVMMAQELMTKSTWERLRAIIASGWKPLARKTSIDVVSDREFAALVQEAKMKNPGVNL